MAYQTTTAHKGLHMVTLNHIDCPPHAHFPLSSSSPACQSTDSKIICLFPLKAATQLPKPSVEKKYEDFSISQFIRFLRQIKLKKILSNITDTRNQNKIKYANHVFLQWALSAFFFRRGSKNSLQTALENLKPYQRVAILNYLGLTNDALPHRTSIDDYFSKINPDEINHLLVVLFRWAKQNKIFYNHAGNLLPGDRFYLACDGLWVHKYEAPHCVDAEGNNACPYCLPRTHNKGKENEKTYWIHAFVNFALIFPGGLQLPIYVHALKAVQMQLAPSASAEKLKQECELQAAHEIFPKIKEKLGNLPVTLLTDSLYANEPVIQLCEQLRWEYLIVRQEGSLKTLCRTCDGLAATALYQKSYRAQRLIKLKNGGTIEQSVQWFNRVPLGKVSYTNILRFEEVEKNAKGQVIRKFKTEWLNSTAIHKGNCFVFAERGRMRADHEDLHNTMKNRGFAAKHDYARANANTWLIWKLLMFVAFWIFELFSCTVLAQVSKGSRSWIDFAKDLFSVLIHLPWEKIALAPSLKNDKIQFRLEFKT